MVVFKLTNIVYFVCLFNSFPETFLFRANIAKIRKWNNKLSVS